MNTTATQSFDRQPSAEEVSISFSSFIPYWILLGVVVMAVLCWVAWCWEARRKCKLFCARGPWNRSATPPTRTQRTGLKDIFDGNREDVNRRITAANAEMEALLIRNNTSVSRANQQTMVDDWPVPNRHTAVRPSAPPAFSSVTPDPTAPPPSYHQLVASNQHETDMVNAEAQLIVTRLEDRGYSNTARLLADVFNRTITYRDMQHVEAQLVVERLEVRGYSNTARVLADVFNRTIPYSRIQSGQRQHTIGRTNVITETNGLPRLHIPPTNTTEANGHRDLITDPSQRSWRSYFNTADRLRELSYSHTRATLNETGVSSTHHQPRSQTPPPMYHEIEEAAVRIARSNSLPSFDEFMATPHKYTT